MNARFRTPTSAMTPLSVLYDGGCPLCRREIALYQRLRARRPVVWVDIDADRQAPERFGISREAAMARFHVIEGGRVHTGAAAFVVLWSAMPTWRHLAATVRGLGLEPLLEQGYARFARRRLARRCADDHCRISSCRPDGPGSGRPPGAIG